MVVSKEYGNAIPFLIPIIKSIQCIPIFPTNNQQVWVEGFDFQVQGSQFGAQEVRRALAELSNQKLTWRLLKLREYII